MGILHTTRPNTHTRKSNLITGFGSSKILWFSFLISPRKECLLPSSQVQTPYLQTIDTATHICTMVSQGPIGNGLSLQQPIFFPPFPVNNIASSTASSRQPMHHNLATPNVANALQLAQMFTQNQPNLIHTNLMNQYSTSPRQNLAKVPTPSLSTNASEQPFVLAPLYNKKIDLTKPLREQRPVLRRSRLRREFQPHRDRTEFNDISDTRERRRMRSTDNARLYRDREKQRMIDLEESIEFLKKHNSRLTIQNTTLKYKFSALQNYIETTRSRQLVAPPPIQQPLPNTFVAPLPMTAHLNESTQVRDMSVASINSALSGNQSLGQYYDSRSYKPAEIAVNNHGEQMVKINAASIASTTADCTTSGISSGSFGSRGSRSRNVKQLSLNIENSNHSSQNSSVKTVIEAIKKPNTADMSVISSNTEWSQLLDPQCESSRIEEKEQKQEATPDTPSCYGSAEPSPADLIMKPPQPISYGLSSLNDILGEAGLPDGIANDYSAHRFRF